MDVDGSAFMVTGPSHTLVNGLKTASLSLLREPISTLHSLIKLLTWLVLTDIDLGARVQYLAFRKVNVVFKMSLFDYWQFSL